MYPMTTLHFTVSWGDRQQTSSFSEVSGLTMEAEVVEYRGGADPQFSTRKQPGLRKFSNVAVERRDVTVSLLNEEREPVMTWKIKEAWPVKIEGPGLKSTGTDVAIESVEFACEGIEIEAK